MFISSGALKRTSSASGDVANVATRLLNLAEHASEPSVKNLLLDEAQKLLEIARELISTIDEVAATNATPETSVLINRLTSQSGSSFNPAKDLHQKLTNALLGRGEHG
jgi:hypothetical protein